jgi:aspartate/tyrosine/aromatic aminotransferase
MRTLTRFPLAALALALAFGAPAASLADQKVGTANYSGNVVHVSMNNIKVYNPKDKSALSFLIWPKFDQIFSGDGKTTYQMKDVKAGQYVKVYYDQKALGMRHADRILILNQKNQKLRRE